MYFFFLNFTIGRGPWCDKGLMTWDKYWNDFLYCSNQYRLPVNPKVTVPVFLSRRLMHSSKCLIKKRRKG